MRYLLYGLQVEADAPLPWLPVRAAEATADLCIRVGAAPPEAAGASGWTQRYLAERTTPEEEPTLVVSGSADGEWLRLRYADGTEFTVDRAGTRLGCAWTPAMTLEDTATYLLGPVMGLVLRLRGVTSLHASAVSLQGRAVLLCGQAGAGKSTTAAAFAARGHALLADDVSALEAGAEGLRVRGAFPHLRLWPDAVTTRAGSAADLPPLTPNWEKRLLDLSTAEGAFEPGPLPLGAIYLLAPREEDGAPRLEPVSATEALLAMIAQTYVGWAAQAGAQGADLALFGRVAREVPVLRAVPHADPARLDALCALIERDAAGRFHV